MTYILNTINYPNKYISSSKDFKDAWNRYFSYLDSIKEKLPLDVYNFARAEWHYDSKDPRSLHDAWLNKFVMLEESIPNAPSSRRSLNAEIELLGAYHDRHIVLKYTDIISYLMDKPTYDAQHRSHGDWLIDEISLSGKGHIVHEVIFRSGARWLIECSSILYSEVILVKD